MWKKAKKSLAFLLALAMMTSLINSEQLFVSAENTVVSEEEAAAETVTVEEEAAPEEMETDAPVEEPAETVEEPAGEEPGAGPVEGDPASLEEDPKEETPAEGTVTEQPAEEIPAGQPGEAEEVPGETEEPGTTEEVPGETEEPGTTEEAPGETEEPGTTEEVPGETKEPGNPETLPDGTVTDGKTELPAEGEGAPVLGELQSEEELLTENPLPEVKTEDEAGQTVEYEVKTTEGYTIHAQAEAGVLPESAELKATQLAEDSQEFAEAKAAVEASGAEFDGIMALDIFFEVDGTEVEPTGEVCVTLEMPEAIPADAAAETVEMNHIVEAEDGTLKAETVADTSDATDGTIELISADADVHDLKAEFVTESFSQYTITWVVKGDGDRGGTIAIPLYAATRTEGDNNFTDIKTSGSVGTITSDTNATQMPIPERAENITVDGKTYTATGRAYIKSGDSYVEVTALKLITLEVSDRWESYTYHVVYAAGNGLAAPTADTYTTATNVLFYGRLRYLNREGWREHKLTDNKVYLEYNAPADPSGPTDPDPETNVDSLSHRKYVTDNKDGTYALSLEIQGAAGSSTKKKELDVLLILDQSGSMKYNMDGTNSGDNDWKPYSQSRWYNAKIAINELMTSLDANENLDTMYSIVTFSGNNGNWDSAYNDAWVRQDWAYSSKINLSGNIGTRPTNDYGEGKGILDYEPSGGTNYQAGFRMGKTQLAKARDTAQKVVIFLSDGEATFYYNTEGMTAGAGNADADGYWYGGLINEGSCSDAAYTEAAGIKNANFFYTIGLGNADAINADVLTNLSKEVKKGSPSCVTNTAHAPFMCGSLDALKAAFAAMVGDINRFTCSDVTITDNLSENVNILGSGGVIDVVPDTDFRIEVFDAEQNPVSDSEGITAHYDPDQRQVVLDFPDNYELKENYTYRVTFTVKPSDIAYQKYAENSGYTDIGEKETGTTSEGKEGFFSNNGASVTYTYRGEERTEYFNNPVVQIKDLAKITITKKAAGLPQELAREQMFDFTISSDGKIPDADYSKYLLGGNNAGKVSGNTLSLADGESVTFVYKDDTKFTFAEDLSSAAVPGYDLTVTPNADGVVKGVLTPTGTNLEVTNTYTKNINDLTITKAVSGVDADAVKADTFTFTVKADDGTLNGTYKVMRGSTEVATLTLTAGTGKVSITGTGAVTIKDLPIGSYTVTETLPTTAPDGYYFDSVTNSGNSVPLTSAAAGSITITNHYAATKSVTVTKNVTGNMGDKGQGFNFTVKVNEEPVTTKNEYGLIVNTDGYAVLKNGESFSITGLHKGDRVIVEEADYSKDGYTTYVKIGNGEEKEAQATDEITVGDTDTSVTFKNDKEIKPPSGIVKDTVPYLLMLLASLGAVVCFFVTRRRRL